MLPERVPYGNKGTFGKVLLVAGSEGMCGAAYLSAAAALKSAAGMVKIQTVEENQDSARQTQLPEAMRWAPASLMRKSNQEMLDWCDVACDRTWTGDVRHRAGKRGPVVPVTRCPVWKASDPGCRWPEPVVSS